MKLLAIAADALIPEYIFGKRKLFPHISQLMDKGASSEYSAYVQRKYAGSYSSAQNWASIYTGLPPWEHGIDIKKQGGEYRHPGMGEFGGMRPFWKELNDHGCSLGLFQPSCCNEPIPIDGYCVTGMYSPIFTPSENRVAKRAIQLCEKDSWISGILKSEPPPRIYPKTLQQLGYTFSQLKDNPDSADEMYAAYDFSEIVRNFNDELHFWRDTMQRVFSAYPVDVVWFYTPSTDIIPHFALHEDDSPVLIDCYRALDAFVGELTGEFNPEIILVMSDHGQANFKEIVKCSDPQIQREAFSRSGEALWLSNGYIAFEAMNGGLLLTTHSLKGVFIACGKQIRRGNIDDMRTLDVYPTLLEMLGIPVPADRQGFVMDIFDRPVLNKSKLLRKENVKRESVALIQTHEVSVMDIVLNELYIESRFADITVVGERKYEEIFRNNPRVSDFVPEDMFRAKEFDKVYCGFYNAASKRMAHVRVL